MKCDNLIINVLNDILIAELTSINMYYIHYKMEDNWGYNALAQHAKAEYIEEVNHMDQIIERLLYFEVIPNMENYLPVLIGNSCRDHLDNQYKFEVDHVNRLQCAIDLCIEKKDFGTKLILDKILKETEGQCDWLETQFQQIDDIEIDNYLTEQLNC